MDGYWTQRWHPTGLHLMRKMCDNTVQYCDDNITIKKERLKALVSRAPVSDWLNGGTLTVNAWCM